MALDPQALQSTSSCSMAARTPLGKPERVTAQVDGVAAVAMLGDVELIAEMGERIVGVQRARAGHGRAHLALQ